MANDNPYEQAAQGASNPYELAAQNATNPLVQASNPYEDAAMKAAPKQGWGNILQNAVKNISQVNPNQVGYEMAGGTAPGDLGMGLGMMASGQPFSKGLSTTAQAEGMRKQGVDQLVPPATDDPNPFVNMVRSIPNMVLNTVTSPADMIGGGALAAETSIGKNVGRMASSNKALGFSNDLEGMVEKEGSKLSGDMGKAMDTVQQSKPDTRISFMDELTRPQMDKKVTNWVGKTSNLHLYDVDNLTLKDSQQIMSDLKASLRPSLKSGDLVKADERGVLSLLGELRGKQLEAFPEHADILKNYGEGVEAYKDVAGDMPNMIEGGGNRIERAAQEQSLKKVSPEAYNQLRGYKNTKTGVKVAGGVTGVGAALGGAKKFLGH